jgi:hypothetical protein
MRETVLMPSLIMVNNCKVWLANLLQFNDFDRNVVNAKGAVNDISHLLEHIRVIGAVGVETRTSLQWMAINDHWSDASDLG